MKKNCVILASETFIDSLAFRVYFFGSVYFAAKMAGGKGLVETK